MSDEPKIPVGMTAEAAAKRVKRTIVIAEGGKRLEKQVPLRAEEVLDFADHGGGQVTVVTVDGQKLRSAPAAA